MEDKARASCVPCHRCKHCGNVTRSGNQHTRTAFSQFRKLKRHRGRLGSSRAKETVALIFSCAYAPVVLFIDKAGALQKFPLQPLYVRNVYKRHVSLPISAIELRKLGCCYAGTSKCLQSLPAGVETMVAKTVLRYLTSTWTLAHRLRLLAKQELI